ncbi:MAG: hypothetical protein ACFHX7_21095 [Pseudomonadota bacterium]
MQPKTNEEPFSPFSRGPDWRVWFGIVISVLWTAMLAVYISAQVGWTHIGETGMDTLGSFLEGAFAPLAFLWFVLAFFSQQKELSQNTTAIKMQYVEIQKSAEQAVIQSEAIRASEMHARKESFLRIADSVRQQLGVIMGFLYLSSQGAGASGAVSGDRIASLWSSMSNNDPEVFSRTMLQLLFRHGERYAYKLLYGTAVRTRHSENFIFNFERLIRVAEACDDDGMIRDSLIGSTHGYVYNHMIRFRDHPPVGFTYGIYDFDPDVID